MENFSWSSTWRRTLVWSAELIPALNIIAFHCVCDLFWAEELFLFSWGYLALENESIFLIRRNWKLDPRPLVLRWLDMPSSAVVRCKHQLKKNLCTTSLLPSMQAYQRYANLVGSNYVKWQVIENDAMAILIESWKLEVSIHNVQADL